MIEKYIHRKRKNLPTKNQNPNVFLITPPESSVEFWRNFSIVLDDCQCPASGTKASLILQRL